MIQGVLKKIFGSRNERLLKQYGRIVREINALEPEISALSDDALRAKTDEFRKRVQERLAGVAPAKAVNDGSPDDDEAPDSALGSAEDANAQPGAGTAGQDSPLDRARREALEEFLPEPFAVVREAGKRVLNMRHFDVQLVGGIALHNGKNSEMPT